MLLSLVSLVLPAFALSVPLRATFTESVVPGETALASATLTATVALSNPASGTSFTVRGDELTVNKREASGGSGRALTFAADPAGTMRTWALYYLDADGAVLGDPEVVDVLFDADGNGAVAAREDGAPRLAQLRVKTHPTGLRLGISKGWEMSVQDSGTDATMVGLVELRTDGEGSELVSDPDMEILDAATFATFQELGLDAILALDTYRTTLDGTVEVGGLSVDARGTVEADAELRWDLTYNEHGTYFGEDCSRLRECASVPVASASYLDPIGRVKTKSGAAPRVALKPADLTFDSYDAGFALSFASDVREFELSAALDAFAADTLIEGADVVTLDPGGLGVQAHEEPDDDTGLIVDIFQDGDCECCGDYGDIPSWCDDDNIAAGTDPLWAEIADDLVDVSVLDSSGGLVATHTCTMNPTPRTLDGSAERDVLVGECTRDTAGTDVRRVRAVVRGRRVDWTVDLAGAAFTAERAGIGECSRADGCAAGETVTVLGGRIELSVGGRAFASEPMTVTETSFDLPFSFGTDVGGLDALLRVDLYGPREATWSCAGGVVTLNSGEATLASFEGEEMELSGTGNYALKHWNAIDGTCQEQSAGPNRSPFEMVWGGSNNGRMNAQFTTYR
ncbi:MAG: hypothetical protein Q8P18_01810 [Pseudomonadota bacterium]|nr:hypothetical protein [Pseudomonadota bacterium]